jgi:hypothetical protein
VSAVALLLALIVSMTGIDRTVDPGLTAIAERRVVEITAEFSHVGMDPCCAEVLAWNSGYADPVTHLVEQWQGSPVHWAILTDPGYTAIGCAVAFVENRAYAACVLAIEPGLNGGGAQDPSSAPSTSATPPPAPALPDTAMGAP